MHAKGSGRASKAHPHPACGLQPALPRPITAPPARPPFTTARPTASARATPEPAASAVGDTPSTRRRLLHARRSTQALLPWSRSTSTLRCCWLRVAGRTASCIPRRRLCRWLLSCSRPRRGRPDGWVDKFARRTATSDRGPSLGHEPLPRVAAPPPVSPFAHRPQPSRLQTGPCPGRSEGRAVSNASSRPRRRACACARSALETCADSISAARGPCNAPSYACDRRCSRPRRHRYSMPKPHSSSRHRPAAHPASTPRYLHSEASPSLPGTLM